MCKEFTFCVNFHRFFLTGSFLPFFAAKKWLDTPVSTVFMQINAFVRSQADSKMHVGVMYVIFNLV